ncbi:mitotic checkpoint serine/threonine-protein kinase BUB1 [Rhodamnia argentea]|uniref:Mitotic checkpoint serine/threonine-protein kinase BUB1 n=1 Tax=Rhodamnia argentea TaxID=178133 RepID=A0A8B8QGU9_9MYRT|nr:mitotic checkpoint serine/threonine-protein kinase BUB1 [Rhodamnia argentea]
MAVILSAPADPSSAVDADLVPWLRSVSKALADVNSRSSSIADLNRLLSDCIATFKDDLRIRNDPRFLKLWIIYLDTCEDFKSVVKEMGDIMSWPSDPLFYELYALFLEARGQLHEAVKVYQMGIARHARGARLQKAQAAFLDRLSHVIATASPKADNGDRIKLGETYVNPWSNSTMKDLLEKINSQFMKYHGYYSSPKAYSGKVALSSLRNSSRNKVIEIGGKKYQIKGCAGQGGFAQVFKAHLDSNPDEVVALKIQKPGFPWEFYMYRQLDLRIVDSHRHAFGFAHRMHVYSDCSILICDYLSHGTLQDAINSYLVIGKTMEEVLCIYYTIEMLRMLETLHAVGIIHGDFKADNLLIRYARDDLSIEGFEDHSCPWSAQGLCLVDWGRGIDLHLFPDNTEFKGDCRTSGFRCVEMQEDKPWRYQADIYGLCVVVHMMLHGTYMEIEKRISSDGSYLYQPKSTFKRYWNVELWKIMFTKLLNIGPGKHDTTLLRSVRQSFEDHMSSNRQLIQKLKDLLVRQRSSLCKA